MSTHNLCFKHQYENYHIFLAKIIVFTVVKNLRIMHGRVTIKGKLIKDEPHCEKTGLRGFRPGLTKTGLCSHRRVLEA